MVVFVVAELRQRDSMLDLSLFRRPAMTGVSITAFTVSASIFAMFLYLTLYIQDDLGYSPFGAGVRFLPISALAFAVAPVAGKLTDRLQARHLLGTGLVIVAVGCALMSSTTATSGWDAILPGLVVAGIGIGMVDPVLASSAVAVVEPDRAGMASGANNTFRQVGIATGIAGLGTVFAGQMRTTVTASLLSTSAGRAVVHRHGRALATALTSGELQTATTSWPATQRHALVAAYRASFSSTLDHLFVIAAVVAAVGATWSYVLVRQRDFVPAMRHSAPAGEEGRGGTRQVEARA